MVKLDRPNEPKVGVRIINPPSPPPPEVVLRGGLLGQGLGGGVVIYLFRVWGS